MPVSVEEDEGHEDHFQYHSAADLDLAGEATDREWSIRCTDVVKRLAGIPVLNGLNVAIPDDMITVVLGPSGTGKSVLIKHLIGLMFPDSGNIEVLGNSVPKLTMPKLLELRRRIGVLFQDGALFGSMSVFDNVAFPLRQHTDMSEGQIGERVRRRLADVGLADAMDDAPSQLSGGMRKRAGFARALVTEPDIVIFDEPDSGSRSRAHGSPVRSDPGDARSQRWHLYRGYAQHRLGAPDRPVHRPLVARADRGSGRCRADVLLGEPLRAPVPERVGQRPARHGLEDPRGRHWWTRPVAGP